jgi:hypothetical protein
MRTELEPILLDVGKVKKRAITELGRGRGKLMDEVERALREAGLGEADGVTLVPVLVVFGRKRKRKKRRSGPLAGG